MKSTLGKVLILQRPKYRYIYNQPISMPKDGEIKVYGIQQKMYLDMSLVINKIHYESRYLYHCK
jgi:hypothetical protein